MTDTMISATAEEVWAEILDELETHVHSTERFLDHPDAGAVLDWEVPSPGVPVPLSLLGRAGELVDRQRRALERIPLALDETSQQLRRTVRQASFARHQAVPVYVDVTA